MATHRSALKKLGMTYKAYLQSDHWIALKKRFYKKYPRQCAICESKGQVDLHHRTYKRLGKERITDLVALCREHHSAFHEEHDFSFMWQKTKSFIRINKISSEKEREKAQRSFDRKIERYAVFKAKRAAKAMAKKERKAFRKQQENPPTI
jgi:hypothetical protein